MGFFDGYNIATSGMSAQRQRINIVSANIANAQTTHTLDKDGNVVTAPYKKQNVLFEEVLLDQQGRAKSINSANKEELNSLSLRGVGVQDIVPSLEPTVLKYEPNHPDANKNGYVEYPNINPVVEMVDLIEAMRSYEANVSAFKTQKDLDTKTLDILKA